MSIARFLIITSVIAAVTAPPGRVLAQDGAPTDVVIARADARSLGTAYAALVNFAISPEISTATMYPEAGEGVVDPRLKATRVPYRKVFRRDADTWRPVLQAVAAFQEMDVEFRPTPDDFIDTRWTTRGLSLAGGVEGSFGEHLDLQAIVNAGYGRLDNVTVYAGPLASELRQALDGVVFDWELDALIYGAGVGAFYDRSFDWGDLELRAGFNHHRIESRKASTGLVEFDSHVSTFDVDFNAVIPTGMEWGSSPVAMVAILGNTTFAGHERDALGFNSFYEAGLAVELDLSAKNWRLKKLRLGAKRIFGTDVSGWGLVIGPGF